MTGRSMGSHERPNGGAKDEWLTPPEILRTLGPFDLDPCAPINRPWPTASTHFTEEDDGLSRLWHGFVWCNPPYRQTWTWLARMRQHRNGIALVFARTETRGFMQEAWGGADAMLFLDGRLRFHHVNGDRADSNAGAPSVLLGYGDEAIRRLDRMESGALVTGWRQPAGDDRYSTPQT